MSRCGGELARGLGAACVALALLAAASTARAQDHDWAVTVANGNSTGGSVYQNRLYYAVGSSIEGHSLASSGQMLGKFNTPTSQTIENFPVVVPLIDTNNYLFVAANDGILYKLDTPSLALSITAGKSQSRDLKRSGCKSGATPDALQATPTVQLRTYANAAYKAARSGDLVFVPTYHGCGDTSLNQIVALDAADITAPPVWVFNAGGEYQVDYISEGCSIDYARNLLYCGSNLQAAHAQNTVWAISTIDGSLLWSANMNSVHNRPQLGLSVPQHVYVADLLGRVHALNPDTGHEDWSVIITTTVSGSTHGVSMTQNLWAEFRPPYEGMVMVSDSTGVLNAIYDGGAEPGDGVKMWSRNFAVSNPAIRVTSVPGVAPTFGKVYVGLNNGTMHQLSMSSGADEATRNISNTPAAGDNVTDPSFNIAGAATDINKIIVTSAGTSGAWMKQFTVPFNGSSGTQLTTCNLDSDCVMFNAPRPCVPGQPGNDCCTLGKCDPVQHFCYENGTAKGAACNDSITCTSNDRCNAGTCAGTWNPALNGCAYGPTQCSIANRFDQGCGPGKVCRKDPVVGVKFDCADVDNGTDASGFTYCGSLSRSCDDVGDPALAFTWGGHRICNKGVCERDRKVCATPKLAAYTSSTATQNAVSINFARNNLANNKTAGACDGYLGSYVADKNSAVQSPPLITYSGSTCAAVTPQVPLCGRANYVALTKASPTTGAISFTDPIGAPAGTIERIQLRVRGYIPAATTCTPASLTVKLNGITLGTFAGKSSACAMACSANNVAPCFDLISADLRYNPDSPPPDTGYVWGGTNTLTISLSGIGNFNISESQLTITASQLLNRVVGLHVAANGNLTTNIYNSDAHPGYMQGVVLTSDVNRSATTEILVPYVNRSFAPVQTNQWAGIGQTWIDGTGIAPIPLAANQTVTTPAVPTDCDPAGKFGCPYPYTIQDFNSGPSPIAGDTRPLYSQSAPNTSGPGRLYIANYRFNGDLGWMRFGCTGTTTVTCAWNYTPLVWKAGNPPYCSTSPCHERVVALDAPPAGQPDSDGLLRVGWGSHLYFVNAGTGVVTYDLDLASTADPGLTSGGSGPWATFGFQNIDAILSLSIDSLNGTNDTYLEVRERRGTAAFDYLVQVRNDHSARPYTDKWLDMSGNKHVGVAADLKGIVGYPSGDNFKDEGRITGGSQVRLHRLVPVKPTAAGAAGLAEYDLAP